MDPYYKKSVHKWLFFGVSGVSQNGKRAGPKAWVDIFISLDGWAWGSNRFARDDKVPGPQLGAKQLPGERPRESAET